MRAGATTRPRANTSYCGTFSNTMRQKIMNAVSSKFHTKFL